MGRCRWAYQQASCSYNWLQANGVFLKLGYKFGVPVRRITVFWGFISGSRKLGNSYNVGKPKLKPCQGQYPSAAVSGISNATLPETNMETHK